jgi:hypothetical protein
MKLQSHYCFDGDNDDNAFIVMRELSKAGKLKRMHQRRLMRASRRVHAAVLLSSSIAGKDASGWRRMD